jgi:hypothetical protein
MHNKPNRCFVFRGVSERRRFGGGQFGRSVKAGFGPQSCGARIVGDGFAGRRAARCGGGGREVSRFIRRRFNNEVDGGLAAHAGGAPQEAAFDEGGEGAGDGALGEAEVAGEAFLRGPALAGGAGVMEDAREDALEGGGKVGAGVNVGVELHERPFALDAAPGQGAEMCQHGFFLFSLTTPAESVDTGCDFYFVQCLVVGI